MAPEQMMGEKVDGRADVFSLAAVAYELLTARAPFPGKTITEVVSRVVHGSHVPPRQADGRLPEGLNAVFASAFAPRPEDRFPRAVDFAAQMQDAVKSCLEMEVTHRSEELVPTRLVSQISTIKGSVVTAAASGRISETVLMHTAPERREGVVMIDSDPPGARIYLDGNPAGQTPLSGLEVAFGRHVMRLEASGRDPVSVEIEIKKERPVKAVTFTLPMPTRGDGEVRPGQLVPFGPDVVPPRRISGSVPAYPEAARERGLEGSPVVEVWVSETGDVIDVAIVESAGAILDAALLQAVASWRFSPPLCRVVPVSMRVTVQHLFRR
jgi:TonB family protein